MTWFKRALLVPALAILSAAPAGAQVAGHPLELSGGAGIFSYDARSHVKLGPAFNGAVGWRWMPWMTLEGQATFGPSEEDLPGGVVRNFFVAGADLRWNLRPAEGRAVPYLITGFGYATSHAKGLTPAKLERGAPSLGAGVLVNVRDQRTYLRLQVRDVMFRERDAVEFSNHVAVTAGLQYVWGGKVRDQDLDGVRDWLDQCPNTPIGAKVDALGCPVDSDRDSVFDGLDQCENTPAGCRVDKNGCPLDADGDGVCDGVDTCPDTPKGATVDASGCPKDSDLDGVLDGIDKCDNTPKGATVDATGCPTDDDNDGVANGIDQCPGTPAGLKVDATGCPIEITERETELLDTGMIRIEDVHFETAKWDIAPSDMPRLDVVGLVLTRWPQLRIEIGGHCDSRGTDAYNLRLSQRRVDSVRSYLLGKFPGLKAGQFTTKGYGERRPIAPNNNDTNMARNRRVDFVVLNKEVLRKEVERRRLLKSNETVQPTTPSIEPMPPPAPVPSPADTTK